MKFADKDMAIPRTISTIQFKDFQTPMAGYSLPLCMCCGLGPPILETITLEYALLGLNSVLQDAC